MQFIGIPQIQTKNIAVNVVGVMVCNTKYLNKTQQMMQKLIEHDHTYHKQKSL